jgi:hypothetical protein
MCCLLTTLGLPVKFDICLVSCFVDELEGVHSKPLHMAIVQGDANVIQKEGVLQDQAQNVKKKRSNRDRREGHPPTMCRASGWCEKKSI